MKELGEIVKLARAAIVHMKARLEHEENMAVSLAYIADELKRHNALLEAQVAGNVLAEMAAGTFMFPSGCKSVGAFREQLVAKLFGPLGMGKPEGK